MFFFIIIRKHAIYLQRLTIYMFYYYKGILLIRQKNEKFNLKTKCQKYMNIVFIMLLSI